MHACLNALSVGTPAIPLAYSRKFEPLLADLGWRSVVDLRTSDDAANAVAVLADRDDLVELAIRSGRQARSSLELADAALVDSIPTPA